MARSTDAGHPLLLQASFSGGPGGVRLRVTQGPHTQVFETDQIVRHPALSATLRLIADEVEFAKALDQRLLGLLFGSLSIYLQRMHTPDPKAVRRHSSRDRQIEQAVELLNQNISKRWTVELLARAVGLSRPAFARRFRVSLGQSPMRYLTGKRMRLAAALLFESDSSLAEIATHIGYDSEFSLSRAFKREFGVAPTKYRYQEAAHPNVVRLHSSGTQSLCVADQRAA